MIQAEFKSPRKLQSSPSSNSLGSSPVQGSPLNNSGGFGTNNGQQFGGQNPNPGMGQGQGQGQGPFNPNPNTQYGNPNMPPQGPQSGGVPKFGYGMPKGDFRNVLGPQGGNPPGPGPFKGPGPGMGQPGQPGMGQPGQPKFGGPGMGQPGQPGFGQPGQPNQGGAIPRGVSQPGLGQPGGAEQGQGKSRSNRLTSDIGIDTFWQVVKVNPLNLSLAVLNPTPTVSSHRLADRWPIVLARAWTARPCVSPANLVRKPCSPSSPNHLRWARRAHPASVRPRKPPDLVTTRLTSTLRDLLVEVWATATVLVRRHHLLRMDQCRLPTLVSVLDWTPKSGSANSIYF